MVRLLYVLFCATCCKTFLCESAEPPLSSFCNLWSSFFHRGRCSWPLHHGQNLETLMWKQSSRKSRGGKEWWEDLSDLSCKSYFDIKKCDLAGFLFFLRNAHSALSWVLPLGVKSRPVWRPTTIIAGCRTKPSTLKTWRVASTSELLQINTFSVKNKVLSLHNHIYTTSFDFYIVFLHGDLEL